MLISLNFIVKNNQTDDFSKHPLSREEISCIRFHDGNWYHEVDEIISR